MRFASITEFKNKWFKEKPPWLEEYAVFGIPESCEPYPTDPVYSLLVNAAHRFKTQGIIQYDYRLTYPEVYEQTMRLATAFRALGLEKGDRVITLLPTSIQFIIADYAISMAGLVHIPCNTLEVQRILIHKCQQGGPKAMICLDTQLDTIMEIKKQTPLKHIIATRLLDYSKETLSRPKFTQGSDILWMKQLIHDYVPDLPNMIIETDKELETLLFTGGTTGLPKGCMLTHRNIYANCIQTLCAFGPITRILEGNMAVLLGLPFSHSYGHIAMHTMTLAGFTQILIPDARDTKSMLQMIQTYHPVLQIGVPTQFMKLARETLPDLGILGLSGSAPLPERVQHEFEEQASSSILEGYGLSEMSPATHLNTSLLIRLLKNKFVVSLSSKALLTPGLSFVLKHSLHWVSNDTVGKITNQVIAKLVKASRNKRNELAEEKRKTVGIPYPDTQIKLVDPETKKRITFQQAINGKRAEMYVKGPQRMLGYWPVPGSGIDDEGYIATGDVVVVDKSGYFYIVDRTKDMIIVSGYKVYSKELDEILYEHPGVEMAATIGIPDLEREGSERVAVFIEPKSDYKLDVEEIKSYLQTRIPKYALPKVIEVVDKIPLTEVQKVDKKQLRELAGSLL
ncbi:MAG: AMP-binding protein [Desulfobacterales bacterium]|nr:AMP-binding protein [Desulfobacterales bacterium]